MIRLTNIGEWIAFEFIENQKEKAFFEIEITNILKIPSLTIGDAIIQNIEFERDGKPISKKVIIGFTDTVEESVYRIPIHIETLENGIKRYHLVIFDMSQNQLDRLDDFAVNSELLEQITFSIEFYFYEVTA